MSRISHKADNGKRKGCLPIFLIVAFTVASGIYFVTAKVRDAKQVEQVLIDRFDWADKYTPPIDGSITPQRLESFIRVREAVQTHCVDYQAILADVIELESLEENQEISAGDKASRGIEGIKSLFSAGPKMMKFSVARNKALLEENMGLGEYLYIYLTAYGEQLANESVSAYAKMDEAYVSRRARKEFTKILANQVTALEASGKLSSDGNLITQLREEIEALSDGSRTSPWPNGPVGKARESFAPFQAQLSELYCSGIVKIELLQKNRGLQLDG
jgi:hypothetical protein